jgi:hypothetical protein
MCYSTTGIDFYSHQWIDVDKFMKTNNLLIGHKQGKKLCVTERLLVTNMTRNYPRLKDYWTQT